MNSTDEQKHISDHHRETIVFTNCALNVPFMLVAVIGNALVLVSMLKTPSIRSMSKTMLASLAFSDLLVGLLAQPLFIADELQSLKKKDPILYRLSAMIGFFVGGVSLGTITVITVDRLLALHYHMRHVLIVTKTRVKYTLGIIWLGMFLSLGVYLWDKYIFHFMGGIFSAVCIIICTFSYIRIYRIVRYHQHQIHVQQNAVENASAGIQIPLGRLKKSAMSTFVFYFCMIVCYFPYFVLLTLFGTLRIEWKPEWTFSTTFACMNSAINPVLYCWRLCELREAVIKTIKLLLPYRTNETGARFEVTRI